VIFYRFIYKFVNFIWYFLCLIKQSLLLIVLPIQSQVLNTDCFPKIAQLGSCCIYNSCNFVSNDKLEILNLLSDN